MLIKTYRLRLYLLYLIPLVLMVGLVVRLYYVQIASRDFYDAQARSQHFKRHSIIPMRGKIFDSEGHELAGSIVLDQAYLNLRTIDPEHNKRIDEEAVAAELPLLAERLAALLNDPAITSHEVLRRLRGQVNRHPLLAKGLNEDIKMSLRAELKSFQDKGVPQNLIEFVPETVRRYSRGSLAPHVVGYMAWDNKTTRSVGVDGVERVYEDVLRGRQENYIARQTARGNPMEPADPELLEATFGKSVKLTINEQLQAVTQNVLQQGVTKTRGDAGVAICYAVKTGEILAMANYPSFDLNDLRSPADAKQNRAVSFAIEPGSVMKIITFAALFNDRKLEPHDVINCEWGAWNPFPSRTIRDTKKLGTVPVAEVFQYSSNIGTIKAARAYDHETFYNHLKQFGFGSKTGLDLPNESAGRLNHFKRWSGYSMTSLPMGYELQLTAVQVVAAVGAIANNGYYMQPHVVKEILNHHGDPVEIIEPKVLRRVVNSEASRKILDLMELVVDKGTAKSAQLPGYRVGGKTGTTKKLVNGRYENAYIASFCGVAPIEDPEICIYVYVDNPKGEARFGGSVAGPIFREIAREAMKILRVPQSRPTLPPEELQKTLQIARSKIEGGVPVEMVNEVAETERGEVTPGVVPELRHMTLREAIETAGKVGLMVIPKGGGTVVDQQPRAHETIEGQRYVHVELENSDQVLTRQLSEVNEYLGRTLDEDGFKTSMTLASLSTTSVPLSLRVGGEDVRIPLWQPGRSSEYPGVSDQTGRSMEIRAAEGNATGQAGRNFEQFMRQYAEVEKQKSQPRESIEVGLEVSEQEISPDAEVAPLPEIDGSEDFDPDVESPTPIEIMTPVFTRDSGGSIGVTSDPNVSLYNFN